MNFKQYFSPHSVDSCERIYKNLNWSEYCIIPVADNYVKCHMKFDSFPTCVCLIN